MLVLIGLALFYSQAVSFSTIYVLTRIHVPCFVIKFLHEGQGGHESVSAVISVTHIKYFCPGLKPLNVKVILSVVLFIIKVPSNSVKLYCDPLINPHSSMFGRGFIKCQKKEAEVLVIFSYFNL